MSCSNGEDFELFRELSIAEDWRGEDQGGGGAEDEDAGQRDGATSASSNQVSFFKTKLEFHSYFFSSLEERKSPLPNPATMVNTGNNTLCSPR